MLADGRCLAPSLGGTIRAQAETGRHGAATIPRARRRVCFGGAGYSPGVTRGEQWSVAGLMVGVAVIGCGVMLGLGYAAGAELFAPALGRGAAVLAVHAVLSLAGGLVAGAVAGPSVAVGLHLGLYHLATPVAVVARVRWLRAHRRGFVGAAWLPVFFGVYVALAGVVWWGVSGRT